MKKSISQSFLFSIFYIMVFLANSSFAASTSTNYQIDNDTIAVGGREVGTSTNYSVSDTLGSFAVGLSTSTNYQNSSGYRVAQSESSISISSPSDLTLTSLSLSQWTSVGSIAWTIETSSAGGYTATIKTSTNPALRDSGTGRQFTDYTEASANVKEAWSVSNAYEFGFSGFGSHMQGYGSDTDCIAGTNVPSATLLWQGFKGTTALTFATSTAANPGGTLSTACFATEQQSVFAPSGTYQTTITITAITN